ncbi:hypothetical protein B0H12DRAFT_1221072, partial [Mycena haematopus]
MSAAPAALPNVQFSYGPMLIGVFLNMILYGVMLGQVLNYFQMYKGDPLWMHLFVWYLSLVGTANTVLDMHLMYEPLIKGYGKFPSFPFTIRPLIVVQKTDENSPSLEPLFVVRLPFVCPTETLPHPPKGPALNAHPNILRMAHPQAHQVDLDPRLITLLAIASFGGGVWTTTMIHILRVFAKKPLLHHPALVWFLTSCVADVLITVSLVWTLTRKKTGFSTTDSVLDKIIRATIQTGMITILDV